MIKTIKPTASIFITLLITLIPSLLFSSNEIRIGSVNVDAGATCTIAIAVTNTDEFTAFQTDIPIPEGFSYVAESATLNPERITGHSLSAGMVGSTLRLIAFSINNTPFPGNTGTLLSFSLKANTIPGNYSLTPQNAYMGNSSSQNILTTNQSGTLTVLSSDISVSPVSVHYGRVALTQNSSQSISISNTGNQNLVISQLAFTDNQFTSTDSEGFTITAGNSKNVSITFTPAQKGTFNKQVVIYSNDPDEPSVSIDLSAIGYTINQLHCGNISCASGKLPT